MNELISNLLTYTLPGIAGSGVLTAIFFKRKTNAETHSIELDNADKIRNAYEGLIDSLKQDRQRLMEEYDRRIHDLEELYTRKVELINQTWEVERTSLNTRILAMEMEIKSLKSK